MPWERIRITENSSECGEIKLTEQVFLPQSVKLFRYRLQTITGLKDRQHAATITINGEGGPHTIGPIEFRDCQKVSGKLNGIVLQGGHEYEVIVVSDGFAAAGERVTARVNLRWKPMESAEETEPDPSMEAQAAFDDSRALLDLRGVFYQRVHAFVRAQLYAFYGPNYARFDDPNAVTADVLAFVDQLDGNQKLALRLGLALLNTYCFRLTLRPLPALSPAQVIAVLNQGEQSSRFPIISWDRNRLSWLRHTTISSLAMISRLVTNSRPAGRHFVGFNWWEPCRDRSNAVPAKKLRKRRYPNLNGHYDVCVIGSGAGGAVVATTAAEAGLNVLIIERGDWIHPAQFVEENPYEDDPEKNMWPQRGDKSLIRLFKGAGVNFAADISLFPPQISQQDISAGIGLLFGRRPAFRPPQIVNISQAQVVGGGPAVNNAIHLRIKPYVWQLWNEIWQASSVSPPCTYEELEKEMEIVEQKLGVNTKAPTCCVGDDARVFVLGCEEASEPVQPLPLSINEDTSQCDDGDTSERSCLGCGSDNVLDAFGKKIGGLHPYNRKGPNSYLMRALKAGAKVAYLTGAERFDFTNSETSVAQLIVNDCHRSTRGRQVAVDADAYVVCAGPIASTELLQTSIRHTRVRIPGLGDGITGNVGSPVYAVFERPIRTSTDNTPNPGIAQCYYVDEVPDGPGEKEFPVLDNWFGYPGYLALGLTGWFKEYVDVMHKHDHLSICGMFVPTKPRSRNEVRPDGSVILDLDDAEFELLLKAYERIAKIFFAAANKLQNPVSLYLPLHTVLLDSNNRPRRIRNMAELRSAVKYIRAKGPAILNLLTTHPQGGNALGTVVDTQSFKVKGIDNLYVADASIFPRGSEINPQLTLKALAQIAATRLVAELKSRIA